MNFANDTLRNLFYQMIHGAPNEAAKRHDIDEFFATYEVAIILRVAPDNSADPVGGAMPGIALKK